MAANSLLPFCPTDTGTNLETDAVYSADANRTTGNKPGVASSRVNNKALKQATLVATAVAQFIADNQATNVDDALSVSSLTAMFTAALGAKTTGRLIARRVFTTTQAYTPTAGTNFVDVIVVAGGGGGGGGAVNPGGQVSAGGGGGGGGWAIKRITSGFAGVTMTVGGGGIGGVVVLNGNNGGSSSFGALLSATGGGGGSVGPSSPPTGAALGFGPAGIGSLGDLNFSGGSGAYAIYANNPTSGKGGLSYGGDGAPPVTGGYVSGIQGPAVGGGGSGGAGQQSTGGSTGGTGANGVIIVLEYA